MTTISSTDLSKVSSIVAEMEAAWNAGDGARFASAFSEDGDQINILGTHLRGRDDIAARHAQVFSTIFRGSRNTLRIEDARYVSANVILAHVHSSVYNAAGRPGETLETRASLLFQNVDDEWNLITFHNTRIQDAVFP